MTTTFFSKHKKPITTGLICLSLLILNFILQIWTNPSYKGMSVDSGTFAYCGERILQGDLLYRDCYDNKPPAVYYLNALAILMTGGRPGGIWLFQGFWMGATAVAYFLVLRSIWGNWPAGISSVIFLLSALFPDYYQEGNYTETYVVLMQVLLVGALYGTLTTTQKRYPAAVGLLTAMAFLLKPTYITMGTSAALIALYVVLRQGSLKTALRRTFSRGVWMLVWLVGPLLLTALYWLARGGLSDLIFAVFIHNRQYVSEGYQTWLIKEVFLKFLFSQPIAYLFDMSLIAGVVALFTLGRRLLPDWRKDGIAGPVESLDHGRAWVIMALLLAIPMEILSVALSGRNFGHYYLTPIPVLSISSAALIYALQKNLRQMGPATLIAISSLVVLGFSWGNNIRLAEAPTDGAWSSFWAAPGITSYQLSDLEQYVADHTSPDQSVLVWATHPSINLVTGRRSPTRYVYPLHILEQTPTGSNGFAELIQELEADPPQLIVAQRASSVGLPDFWSEDDALCTGCTEDVRQGLLAFKTYINAHYEFGVQIFDWYIYRRLD